MRFVVHGEYGSLKLYATRDDAVMAAKDVLDKEGIRYYFDGTQFQTIAGDRRQSPYSYIMAFPTENEQKCLNSMSHLRQLRANLSDEYWEFDNELDLLQQSLDFEMQRLDKEDDRAAHYLAQPNEN